MTYMECDSKALAQEYCDAVTAQMDNGNGPIPGNVTTQWAIPEKTRQSKWVARKHPTRKVKAKTGRRQKEASPLWFAATL